MKCQITGIESNKTGGMAGLIQAYQEEILRLRDKIDLSQLLNKLAYLEDQRATGSFIGVKSDINAEIYYIKNNINDIKDRNKWK